MEFIRDGAEERSDVDGVRWNDWLGRTRAPLDMCIGLVQELPGFGAIKPPNPGGLNEGRIKVAKIDAHSVSGPTDWLPVRDATAVGAPKQPEVLVAPCVTSQIILACENFYPTSIVVAPESTVTATD